MLGLGANLGDPEKTLRSAVECIKRLPRVTFIRCSSMYVTAPVETPDAQPDYINMIVEVETDRSPYTLLGMCLGIESAHMRERPYAKAARTLDIDLLMCGSGEDMISIDSDELKLPHPRVHYRAFVLVPLAELYPGKIIFGDDFSRVLDECSDQSIYLLKSLT